MPLSLPTERSTVASPGTGRPRGERLGALRAAAVAAFREGRDVPWNAPAPVPVHAQEGSEGRPRIALGELSAADRATLAKLEPPREESLALARAGRMEEAEGPMKLARVLLSFSRLAPAGRAYAETMQQAAESYLSYRRGDAADAYDRMRAALEATDRLSGVWGECEFIVCRRVDLAHNLMRVELRRGAPEAAVALGAPLLESLCEGSGGATHPPILDPRIAAALAELVVGTVAEALAPLSAPRSAGLLRTLRPTRGYDALPSPRVRAWMDVRAAAARGDVRRFLKRAAPFLREGRGRAPALWYAVALELAHACRTADTPAGVSHAREIAGELASAPRVPACMRIPAG